LQKNAFFCLIFYTPRYSSIKQKNPARNQAGQSI